MTRTNLVVLAVDDDIINLKLLKSMLTKSGHVKEVIDLILLDIIMPIMGGIDMLKVVRADDNLRQLPIIVLTTDETKKSEALEYGANGFLMKPIRNDDLLSKMETVIV